MHLQTQMRKGFERVAAEMDDIKLDLPTAPSAFADYRKQVTFMHPIWPIHCVTCHQWRTVTLDSLCCCVWHASDRLRR